MKTRAIFLTFVAFFTLAIVGCTENIDESNRYVFKERTIMDYLKQHEEFSEYVKLLYEVPASEISQTTVGQLLTARGHYTVFAPTNEAIQTYLNALYDKKLISEPSWSGFPNDTKLDSIRKLIVYNSVIDSGDNGECYETINFPTTQNAEILQPNMYDWKPTVRYGQNSEDIYVNGSPIDRVSRDIPAINGVVHKVGAVVVSNTNTLGIFIDRTVEEKVERIVRLGDCSIAAQPQRVILAGLTPEAQEHFTAAMRRAKGRGGRGRQFNERQRKDHNEVVTEMRRLKDIAEREKRTLTWLGIVERLKRSPIYAKKLLGVADDSWVSYAKRR